MPQDIPQFVDFELLVGPARQPGSYPLTIVTAQAGEATGTLSLNPDTPEIQSALEAIAGRSTTEDLLRFLGGWLFDALMADPIGDLYHTSLGLAQGAGRRLRMRLRIEPPEVAALPWEYVYDRQADLPLAISTLHCLSRYVPINEPVRPLQVEPPLRILDVVSDPSDLGEYGMPALDAGEEIVRIQKALQEREVAGEVKTDVLPHAVTAELREKLRTFRPHVVHFIGHGGFQNNQGVLVMEDDEHKTRLVSDRQFREFFLGADDARLVVLNACQGATQSSARALTGLAPQVVRRGLGAVVAMQYPIPDKVALVFAREFYRALAQFYPVDAAVAEGRRAVYMDFGSDRPDWGTPVIFMRSSDGNLFGPPPARQEAQSPQVQAGSAGVIIQGGQINIVGDVAGRDIIRHTVPPPAAMQKEGAASPGESGQYDVFISYSHRDEDWVQNWLLPQLENAGIRVCIDFRDFQPGAPSLVEMERAVLQSRKTLLVLTSDYLNSDWAEFENIVVQTLDPAARQRRLLPLLLKPCELPVRIRMLTYLDFTRSDRINFQLERLVAAIGSDAGPSAAKPAVPPAVTPPSPGTPGLASVVASGMSPTQLREILVSRFDVEELRTLCFDLGVEWDNLGGEGKAGKARELIAYMQRRGQLPNLIAAIRQARPDIQ